MTTLKREPLQIVEFDIDYCSRTYGSAPCTATLTGTPTGVRKCFNTFFTCQDTANYDAGTLTLRYAKNQNGLPLGTLIYPALVSVSTNPTKINLGGVGDRIGSLGKRARVEIVLQDFTDSDIYTDKYRSGRVDGTAQTDEGGYNPQSRGTHFGKMRRRFPYYQGRAIRVLEGYVGDSLASMRTRNYVVTEWRGPDASGKVRITASDILDLANDDKALCPTPNSGVIQSDISAAYLSTVTLTPSGVGNNEYAASGFASIGSEIVSFTRSGDTVTLTGRAQYGSTAATHTAGDSFQQCYVADDQLISDTLQDWLEDFAGVSSSFVPISNWQTEETTWLSGYRLNGVVPKPTGVTKLISEVLELGLFLYWDDIDQEIKMVANRPIDPGSTIPSLTDGSAILEKTAQIADLHDKRLSRVIFWHGVLDYSDGTKDGNNFAKAYLTIDTSAEGANEYNQDRTHEIFCRWLGPNGDDTIAGTVAQRLLNRFRDTPREVNFAIDVKDESDTRPAAVIAVTSRVLQDDTGNSLPTNMQVTAVEESAPGHKLKITAQTYTFAGRYGYITENSRSDYAASSASEKEAGTYIVGGSGTFGDGTGPYLMF